MKWPLKVVGMMNDWSDSETKEKEKDEKIMKIKTYIISMKQ